MVDSHGTRTGGPYLYEITWKIFEGFIISARTDRYNIMCSIDAYEIEHPSSSCDDGSSGGVCPLPITRVGRS